MILYHAAPHDASDLTADGARAALAAVSLSSPGCVIHQEGMNAPGSPVSLAALDADIAFLAEILDGAIAELSSAEVLAKLDALRDEAVALREERLPGGRAAFSQRFADQSLAELALVARAFTLWFHLVNAAEQQHRIRVLRDRDRRGKTLEGSLAAALGQLAEAGVSAAELRGFLARMFVMPVLTAHPTEARRRTVLDHLAVVTGAIDTLDRTQLSGRERAELLERLRRAVAALYVTEESRAHKPSPRDELESGMAVFEVLLEVTPAFYREFEDALASAYPGERFEVPSLLRWGSWIGGDRDGNPFVTSEITRAVLERHRTVALRRYLRDVEELRRSLSVSLRRVARATGLAPLEEDLERERERLPEVAARALRYGPFEPWREKLWYMRERLEKALTRGDAGYFRCEDYLADLRLLETTLEACGLERLAAGALRNARRRAEVFGFHLASLDVRQHSSFHERAVAEILAVSGHGDYAAMTEAERVARLCELLDSAEPLFDTPRTELCAETRELLATLEVVGRARREQGHGACERYVVSFTSQVSDLLEVLVLQAVAGLAPGELRPVPLLEQLEDLDRGAEIAEQMLTLGPLRRALGGELEVMIGYSDAGKQVGFFAAAVALRRAQLALARVAERHDVPLTIFHGRGGAIGRGGGPGSRAIRAQPPQAVRGRLRVTEQGETIRGRYGHAEVALRDLEQMTSAVLLAILEERVPPPAGELAARNRLFDSAAGKAQASYDALLADPERLARYAIAATPIQQVAKLPIGSRPASRKQGLSFQDLRAIPWVFSWNQSRHGLPGWFGLGTALEEIAEREGIERARELFRDSPFFRALINNAQLALTRADIDVAAQYAELADDDAKAVFELIASEHERTVRRLLEVLDRQSLLGNRSHLMTTVKRRNPYVDVLSHAQIELLGRLRRSDSDDERQAILDILFITINGIAAGLQTAG